MKPVLPSEVVGLIDECFPALADHTQVGAGADHTNLAKVVEAMSAIPEACVPAGVSMRYAAAQGTVSTALRAWEGGQRNRFYLNGGHIRELREVLDQCSDEPFADEDETLEFIGESEFERTLAGDRSSAHRALHHGEWKASTVLSGSVIEALLIWALQERSDVEPMTQVADRLVKEKTLSRLPNANMMKWSMSELIEVASGLGLIQPDTAEVSRSARDYRNLIHPGREIRTGHRSTKGTSYIVVGAMERVIEDLRAGG